jgi:hypothetical protein
MSSNIDELREVFGALIADINCSITKGQWFQIVENPTGNEQTENVITLRDQTKLDPSNYTRMLEICGLVINDSAKGWRLKSDAWEAFIGKYVTHPDFS